MYFPTASEGDFLRQREENQQRNCGGVTRTFTKSDGSAPYGRYLSLLHLSFYSDRQMKLSSGLSESLPGMFQGSQLPQSSCKTSYGPRYELYVRTRTHTRI
jgi:hypothetical protein